MHNKETNLTIFNEENQHFHFWSLCKNHFNEENQHFHILSSYKNPLFKMRQNQEARRN